MITFSFQSIAICLKYQTIFQVSVLYHFIPNSIQLYLHGKLIKASGYIREAVILLVILLGNWTYKFYR